MTFAAVGSFLQATTGAPATSLNITLNNQGVGNLILMAVRSTTAGIVPSSITGGGATWSQIGTTFTGSTNAEVFAVFQGRVTATGAQTATANLTGGSANIRCDGQEFSSTVGSWVFDSQATLDGTGTLTWPSLTPVSSGELYFGSAQDATTAVAGSTPGYTYQVDANSNGTAWNPNCAAGTATAPTWADTGAGHIFGIMILVRELGVPLQPRLAWLPQGPSAPGGQPFMPWPQYQPGAGAGQDVLNAAATVTATITATLTSAPAPWELPPQYPPGWFPGQPPGEPFTPWAVGLTDAKFDPVTAAITVTAAGAAALTESKPLNAATTITASGAAAETTSKPLTAAQTITATAAASLDVVKAAQVPLPEYPPAWFPGAPGVPAGEPFAPWPVWSGFAGTSTPQDVLNAAQTITAGRTAALTETKPINAATTVTATITAALTTSKPLTAAQTVTATGAASLSDVSGGPPPITAVMPLLRAPAWFPGAPGVPAAEPFTSWPGIASSALLAVPGFPGAVTITSKNASPLTLTQASAAVTITSKPASPATLTQASGAVTITSKNASPVTVRSQI